MSFWILIILDLFQQFINYYALQTFSFMKTTSQNQLLVKAYLWSGFSNLNFSPQNKWIFEWYTKNPSNDNQWALQSSQGNSVKPSHRKKFINWLFLLLGQMLGYCTLQQLKYLFKHTKNHWPKPKKKKKTKETHQEPNIGFFISLIIFDQKKKSWTLQAASSRWTLWSIV